VPGRFSPVSTFPPAISTLKEMFGSSPRGIPGLGPVLLTFFLVLGIAGLALGAEDADSRATPGDSDPAPGDAEEDYDPLFDDEFDDFELEGALPPDPLEDFNRVTQALNESLDDWVLDPVTRVYRWVTPEMMRQSLRNFFWNLSEPTTVVNDLLQREWDDAAVAITRLAVNSTLGVGGFFDPASELGLEAHDSDFGQTLALAGVGPGPYLVLPVLGPSNVRDGFGLAVDVAFRPSTFFIPIPDQLIFTTIQGGGWGLTMRDQQYDHLRALRESSIDFYAALRSAYAQNRNAEIWNRREHHRDDAGGR
jgi:phospholipid-binding lipoprotein MlaA